MEEIFRSEKILRLKKSSILPKISVNKNVWLKKMGGQRQCGHPKNDESKKMFGRADLKKAASGASGA